MLENIDSRVLLITMPLADPTLPNLAIEQLASIARMSGIHCDVLYGALLLPLSVPGWMIHSVSGPLIFNSSYYGLSPEAVASEAAQATYEFFQTNTSLTQQETIESLTSDYLIAIEAAEICLERCLNAIPKGRYDIVGFSVGFDAQKLPSATLASQLKIREPETKILFGGTGCDGDMGQALMEVFPQIDIVLQGEGELNFVNAIKGLRGGQSLHLVSNCLYRVNGEILENSIDKSMANLNYIPPPDYHSYLEQRAVSSYNDYPLVLLFETSRGCWWGKQNQCSFCGIKSVMSDYRKRSAVNAIEHVLMLQEQYDPDLLYATDAILPLSYLKSVLPELARRNLEYKSNLSLFYEIKSNLRRKDMAILATAGVKQVQPGIESFSTNVLNLTNKGANALQQVELLKWAQTYEISVIYSILVGIPGENLEDYSQIIKLMPLIKHLPPPQQINRLALHKFSPYAKYPEGYGFQDIRPFQMQRLIYRVDDDVLLKLCYESEYNLPEQETIEMIEKRKYLSQALDIWKSSYSKGIRLNMTKTNDSIIISRCSWEKELRLWVLKETEALVYNACQHVVSINIISNQIQESIQTTSEIIDRLATDGLVVALDNKCLALAVPTDADAWYDAGLAKTSEHSVAVNR